MFMVASSVVTTIMILNLHHRLPETHTMPFWVGYSYLLSKNLTLYIPSYQVRLVFLNWIPRILRMSRPGNSLNMKTLLMERSLKEIPASSDSKSLLFKALDMAEDMTLQQSKETAPKQQPTLYTHPLSPGNPQFASFSPPGNRWLQSPCCPQANHVFPQPHPHPARNRCVTFLSSLLSSNIFDIPARRAIFFIFIQKYFNIPHLSIKE